MAKITPENEDAARRGIEAAAKRCSAEGFEYSDLDKDAAWDPVFKAVVQSDQPWTDRGLELFSEIVAVGVFSRMRYEHEPVDEEDVSKLGWIIRKVLNSWFHE